MLDSRFDVVCSVVGNRLLPAALLGNCTSIGSVPAGSCPAIPDIPWIVPLAPLPFLKLCIISNIDNANNYQTQ